MNQFGVIHGRFQVLHNDHLKYLMAGKELCHHLIVGITNPDPVLTSDVDVDPKRSESAANPMTYYERMVMVREVLLEAGVNYDQLSIVPFPITRPDLYRYYVPLDAVFFLSIYDDWGRKKLSHFKSLGLDTHVLWEVPPEQKGLSSTDIRGLMAEQKPWEHLVPQATARVCNMWKIPDRLRSIQAGKGL
ncbi:nicotinate-nucleotide adenylyltransferase [Desulfonatronovibrio magnus]|uniref:nicotinate-nucleotide adenylyltransferase n=1 Tax=Desulfonatronovibrio magnus TaxID=698827 RepID=UPI0005EBE64E|nr:nicotinate-nucleotide adenylyltransferase [Desulfonatronovibrio magnus]